MRLKAWFTFETESGPPQTWSGVINASRLHSGARLAINAAKQAFPGSRWSSVVIVLEKLAPVEVDEAHDGPTEPAGVRAGGNLCRAPSGPPSGVRAAEGVW